jgi:hippurate hydrolase
MAGELGLPLKGSEDFGRFMDIIPGAFLFVSGTDAEHKGAPHNPKYNFNDRLIPIVA